ncbi:hypothetical protein Ancab_034719 [Ancistrocladus abbreviatus]
MAAHHRQSSWLYPLSITRRKSSSKTNLFLSITPKPSSFKTLKISSCVSPSNAKKSQSPDSSDSSDKLETTNTDRVKFAFGKAKEYKDSLLLSNKVKIESEEQVDKNAESGNGDNGESLSGDKDSGKKEIPQALRIAMEKAKEYKKNKGPADSSKISVENENLPGDEGGNRSNVGKVIVENDESKKEELKISTIDFMGLDFADKKKGRGLPAGLVPIADPFADDDLPEVELLVGDTSKFGNARTSQSRAASDENLDLYKPKVSTWGVFPRPSNISTTFGGGRTIHPGEALETAEDKAAKQACTRELIAAYKSKIGLNIDAKLKAVCEKALKDGDFLMDAGKLKEALPYYQKVMDKLAFQSELHGLAALQWSICQDSLSRVDDARVMYEKLQSHPNAQVSKRARQFSFGFQAMEMMKVRRSIPRSTGYQKYFEAFVEDKVDYTPASTETEEGDLVQALPYIIFLASPILLVLLIAATKRI